MRERTKAVAALALCGLLLAAPAAAEGEDKGTIEGEIELIYRSVSVDGSEQKYNEDFDGLESGGAVENVSVDWRNPDGELLDFANLDLRSLGGEPYESSRIRLGKKGSWKLSFNNRKQVYLYDLFEVTPDEDANTWDTERRLTDLNLNVRATERVGLMFQFQEGNRSGNSLFLKDISRELFQLETPLEQTVKRYTAGFSLNFDRVDLVFRQTLRRYDNQFDNFTEGNLGLDLDGTATVLNRYDWRQSESGTGNYTNVLVNAELGSRVDLSVELYGDFFGEDELTSRVEVEQLGINFAGFPFGGSCSVSGAPCGSEADCDPVGFPGDTCVANTGTSEMEIETETTLIDLDLSVAIAEPVDLHLQYRSLQRDLVATGLDDLDGDGIDLPVDTTRDYEITTATALFEIRPISDLTLRAGYRTIDRELDRELLFNSFDAGGVRNADYESNGDETLVLGATWKAAKWAKLAADYEDGDVDTAFTQVSPFESERTRVRATFTPQSDMRFDVNWIDAENVNTGSDFRGVFSGFESMAESNHWSASFWHGANDWIDYSFRYASQEIETRSAAVFDTAGFGAVEDGDTIFDADYTQWSAQLNFTWAEPWRAWLRYWVAEGEGNNIFLGDVAGLINDQVIDQQFDDLSVGLRYTFDGGIFLGASVRVFDYEDGGCSRGSMAVSCSTAIDPLFGLLDYDGSIIVLSGGTTF